LPQRRGMRVARRPEQECREPKCRHRSYRAACRRAGEGACGLWSWLNNHYGSPGAARIPWPRPYVRMGINRSIASVRAL
jgi:hypothetical protein